MTVLALVAVACSSTSAASPDRATAPPPSQQPQATAAIGPDGVRAVYPTVTILGNTEYNVMPVARHTDDFSARISKTASYAPPFEGLISAITLAPGTDGNAAYVAIGSNIHLADLGSRENVQIGEIVGQAELDIERLHAGGRLVVASLKADCYQETCGDVALFEIDGALDLEMVARLEGEYRAVAIDGDFVYLASLDEGVAIYLVESGEQPALVATITPPAPGPDDYTNTLTTDVQVDGGRAYVAFGPQGMAVYDVSRPWSPELLKLLKLSDARDPRFSAEVIAVSGNTALVAESSSPSRILRVDISDPGNPVVTGTIQLRGLSQYWTFTGLEIAGDTGFYSGWVGDWTSSWSLGALDLSNPDEIRSVGRVTQNGAAGELASTADHVYLPVFGTLEVVRIADVNGNSGQISGGEIPGALVSNVKSGSAPSQIYLRNGHAFVFSAHSLRVFDITQPGQVEEVAALRLNGQGPSWVEKDSAYFFLDRDSDLNEETFRQLDISSPAEPRWIDPVTREWYPVGGTAAAHVCPGQGLADVCYRANQLSEGGPYGLGVRQPIRDGKEFPVVLVPDSTTEDGVDLTVGDELIFVVAGNALFVFSGADPHAPELLARQPLEGAFPTGVRASQVLYEDGRVYALLDGLWVIDVSTPAEPNVVGHYPLDAVQIGLDGSTMVLVDGLGRLEVIELQAH